MAKNKSKTKYIVLPVLALLIAGAVAWSKMAHRDPPISVTAEKAARRSITEVVVANGKIEPVVGATISPEVSGEIIVLAVKAGQKLNKGDLLFKIRPDNYLAARNSAEANYKYSVANRDTAAANLEKADLEYKRNDALFKAKLISESDYLVAKNALDVARTTLAGASEQVSIAHAQLDSAEADLSKTTVYSPLSGTVSELNSQLGERVVGTGQMAGTSVMTVADLTAMEARVDIGEIDVPLIKLGQKAVLEVDSFKDRKFSGYVTEIARSANNNALTTGSSTTASSSSSTSTDATKFQVKIRINDKEEFLPGMSVTANVETRYRTNTISVPIQSVTARVLGGTNNAAGTSTNNPVSTGGTNSAPPKPSEIVFLIQGDKVKAQPVKRGIGDDNYTEIIEGLKEGDEVVSGGYKAIGRDLQDGKKIVVNTQAASTDRESKF